MHSTISTLCISISHLVTKSRTIFRCIWMQYVCACVRVCATFILCFTFYGLLFFFGRLFVHCMLGFHWKSNFPFSFFHFCLFVANQIKPRKIFSLVSSLASYVCPLYFTSKYSSAAQTNQIRPKADKTI